MTDKKENKSRTSITIDPALWSRARDYCATQTKSSGKKLSFSEFVERALTAFLDGEEQ